MTRPPKVLKSIEERVQDCETHLAFLQEALNAYERGDRERYKQIAGELRILVCRFNTNKPLLLDLMDHYGFAYDVEPRKDGPPQIKPEFTLAGTGGPPWKRWEGPLPLRRYVDEVLALYIRPYDYTYARLSRAIAEQTGGAHEDDGIEEGMAAMRHIVILNEQGHIGTLISFAGTILRAGTAFLGFMIANHGYQLRRFKRKEPTEVAAPHAGSPLP